MEKSYTCDKCYKVIPTSKVKILNRKAICPYCNHTLETDKFKVELIEKYKSSEKQKRRK